MARNHYVTEIPDYDISFDAEAFDQAVVTSGVRLVHYRALPCPIGMTDVNDNRRSHEDHSGCSGGFIYKKCGTVTALFTSNSKNKRSEDAGFIDNATVQITTPRHYDDPAEKPFLVAPFDRFYLDEEALVVPMWERYLHSSTGYDRLKFPVVNVEDLYDNRGREYQQNVDFTVENGQIVWKGNTPGDQLEIGGNFNGTGERDRGAVCSVRYSYRPYWYVGALMHELRVAQIQGEGEERTLTRMPQAFLLHREYVSLNQQAEPEGERLVGNGSQVNSSDVLRRVMGPLNGGFNPGR